MTCNPPPGTKPGTLHVLRKPLRAPLLATLIPDGNWMFPRWDAANFLVPPAQMVSEGWRYAGPAPELPRVPQTAQEIAREALADPTTEGLTFMGLAKHRASALRRIADMEPQS